MTDKGMSASPLEALKGGFRRACVRRLVGDEQGAISVLKDEIPKLVVSWAKTSNLDAGEKKVKLKEMFDDESARADELATAFDLFAGRFERRVADLVTREIKKACQRVEKVADALEIFKDNLPKITINDGAAGNVGHIEDLTETRVDQPALRVEDEAEPEVNKVKIDEAEVEAEEIIFPEDPDPVDEELEELDEPLGMGLKFDEIEEMIDEVLSMEN